jgi:Zn-dependent protease
MGGAWTLFRIRGTPIRMHFSWLLIAPYLVTGLGDELRAAAIGADIAPADLSLPIWAWGCLLTLVLVASVTLHELGHVWMARRAGAHIEDITLLMFGGVSRIGRAPDPRAEARIAVAGPIVSVILAATFWLWATLARGGPPDLELALVLAAQLNLMLAAFNLLPAFPMDGGRVLQSLLARRLGSTRATTWAARVGAVLAVAMGLWAVAGAHWWLALIAVYLLLAGRSEVAALPPRDGALPPASARP